MSKHRAAVLVDELRGFCHEALALVENVDIDDYLDDWQRRRALERVVFLIGEAATHLHRVAPHLDLPWHELKGIRNLLAHQYRRISHEILFHDAQATVPQLVDALDAIGTP